MLRNKRRVMYIRVMFVRKNIVRNVGSLYMGRRLVINQTLTNGLDME